MKNLLYYKLSLQMFILKIQFISHLSPKIHVLSSQKYNLQLLMTNTEAILTCLNLNQ